MKQRYDELIALIEKANYEYYTLDNPTLTDREYDNMMSELLDIEEKYPELRRPDSPTQKVGGEIISEFKKVQHKIPMFSIADVFNESEIVAFDERVRKELMRDISEILRKEIRDLEGVVSIVDVEVSHDNSFAKVIYSVLGSEEQIEKTKSVIEKSTAKIRYNVGKVLRLRLTPELRFVYTNGLEESSRVVDLINKISRGEIK